MTAKLVSKASRLSSKGTLDAAAASRLQGALAGDDDNPLFLGGIRVPPAEAITDAMGTAIATGLTVIPVTDMYSDACWQPQSSFVRLSCLVYIAIPSNMVGLQLPSTPYHGTCCILSRCAETCTLNMLSSNNSTCHSLWLAALLHSQSVMCKVFTQQPNKQRPRGFLASPLTHS